MTSPAVTPQTAVKLRSDPPQSQRFTFEEYCVYEDSTDHRYELVRGYSSGRVGSDAVSLSGTIWPSER